MAKDDGVGKKVVDATKDAAKGLEGFAKQAGRADKALDSYTGSVEAAAAGAVDLLTTPWRKMAQLIGTNTEAFEQLNKTGMSFGNSMNNIRMSAADMRMGLDEFTRFMGENQKSFASLGGTVGKGAQNFAEMSKLMQANSEKLTQMGYGYEELNQILAIQVGASKAKIEGDEAARNRQIAGAIKLAEEMDGLAKLTGVSRKEQEETRKALQKDMAFEAAMRQETRNMTKEDAEKYRAAMMDLVATTEATQGAAAGAAIKESIITGGSLQSGEAMAHASLNNEAYQKSMEAREKIKQGDYEGAKRSKESSDAAAITSQNSDANLSVARYVGGTAGNVAKGTMAATQTQFEGLKSLEDSLSRQGKTISDVNELMGRQKAAIKQEQEARDGVTAAMITTKNRLADATAATTRVVGETMGKGSKMEQDMLKVSDKNSASKRDEYANNFRNSGVKGAVQLGADLAGTAVVGLDKLADEAVKLAGELKKWYDQVKQQNNERTPTRTPGSRDGGTLEKTGSPIEPMDALVKIHKGETVLSPESTKNMAKQLSEGREGMTQSGREGMTQMSPASISKMLGQPGGAATKSVGGAMPGIDINKILTDIKTTVSKVEISNWPKELKDIGKAAPVQTQPAAPAPKPAEVKKEEPKPAPKAAEAKPAEKPAEKPPEAKPAEKPPEAKPAEKPPGAKPAEKPPEAKPAEVKSPNTSESYKINGKEVGKEDFDKHMEANPALAKLMDSAKANLAKVSSDAGSVGGMTPSVGGSGDPVAEAAASMERMKAQQAQFNKDVEDAELERLIAQQANLKKTQDVVNEELGVKQQANEKELDFTNSFVLTTAGLNNRQREMHGELAKLTLEDSKEKLEANKKQQEATLAEMRAIDSKANAIEATAKKEGRALTESEEAQVKALDEEASAKSKARQKENARMADENKVLERLIRDKTMAEKAGMETSIAENGKIVKVMEQNSKKIAEDIKEALPVKDVSASSEQVGDVYQKHGESVLGFAKLYTDEQMATYKEGAETSLKQNKEQLEENNVELAGLRTKAMESELSTAEQQKIKRLETENALLESGIKYNEAEIEAYKKVENEKKGIVTESTAKIAETISEALPVKDIEKGKELLEERIKLQNEAEEKAALADEEEIARIEVAAQAKFAADEEAAIAQADLASLLPKTIDLEKERIDLQNKAEQDAMAYEEEEIARIDAEAQAKFAADEEAAIAQADLASLIPKPIDLEKMGGDMLANMVPDKKYSDQDSASRTTADINQPSINKAKSTKFSDISVDASGMPVIRSKAESLKKEEPKKEPSPGKKINPETGEEYTPVDESKPSKSTKEGAKEQKSNLDDVVKKLELLNTTMNNLIKKTEEAAANQVKATKGIASGNLFGAR